MHLTNTFIHTYIIKPLGEHVHAFNGQTTSETTNAFVLVVQVGNLKLCYYLPNVK